MREFLAGATAGGATGLVGGCLDLADGGGLPFWPFVAAIREHTNALDETERAARSSGRRSSGRARTAPGCCGSASAAYLWAAGDCDSALEAYAEALRLVPADPQVLATLRARGRTGALGGPVRQGGTSGARRAGQPRRQRRHVARRPLLWLGAWAAANAAIPSEALTQRAAQLLQTAAERAAFISPVTVAYARMRQAEGERAMGRSSPWRSWAALRCVGDRALVWGRLERGRTAALRGESVRRARSFQRARSGGGGDRGFGANGAKPLT